MTSNLLPPRSMSTIDLPRQFGRPSCLPARGPFSALGVVRMMVSWLIVSGTFHPILVCVLFVTDLIPRHLVFFVLLSSVTLFALSRCHGLASGFTDYYLLISLVPSCFHMSVVDFSFRSYFGGFPCDSVLHFPSCPLLDDNNTRLSTTTKS
jgi:hypothetical protein